VFIVSIHNCRAHFPASGRAVVGSSKNMRSHLGSGILLSVFLSAPLLAGAPVGVTSVLAGEPTEAPPQSDGTAQAEPNVSAPAPDTVCQALATAAAANDLPSEFFTRLIWQESRFKADAVSRVGAQGVAQFMPGTARWRGLADPFDPIAAIAKSAELLRDLRQEFGNLGLAAAAYNAGPGRVHDWLAARRPLPGETRAYVRIVTGHSAEEWLRGQPDITETPSTNTVPCSQMVGLSVLPNSLLPLRTGPPKPWGVELVGGPTQSKALAAYHKLEMKYSALLAGRETHVVIRGVPGEMGAARVRVDAVTRAEANKLCNDLKAAGWGCDVLRN
jgi:hypothetical protein